MDSTLREELDKEKHQQQKSRAVKYISVFAALSLFITGLALALSSSNDSPDDTKVYDSYEAAVFYQDLEAQSDPEEGVPNGTEANSGSTSTNDPQNPYVPAAPTFNEGGFINSATDVLDKYGEVVALVSFSDSASNEAVADKILQAIALDDLYFISATDVRAEIVDVEDVDQKYVEITELIEQGVSSISVGVEGMEDWANNPTSRDDLEASLRMVEGGAVTLLEASEKLDQL